MTGEQTPFYQRLSLTLLSLGIIAAAVVLGKRRVVASAICHSAGHIITSNNKLLCAQRYAAHTVNRTSGSFNVDRNGWLDLLSIDSDHQFFG
jgi:hypothetical protein